MRFTYAGISALLAVFVLAAGSARSGEENIDINDLKYGMRYCPAPWCDNKEFIDTHFGIDAKIGKVMKFVGNQPPVDVGYVDGVEEVLYVSPPTPVGNPYITSGNVAAPQPWGSPSSAVVTPPPRVQSVAAGRQSRPVASMGRTSSYRQQPVPQQHPQAYAQLARAPRRADANFAARQPSSQSVAPQSFDRPATRGQKQPTRLPWWKAMWR